MTSSEFELSENRDEPDEALRRKLLGPDGLLVTKCREAVERGSLTELDAHATEWIAALRERYYDLGAEALLALTTSIVNGDPEARQHATGLWRELGPEQGSGAFVARMEAALGDAPDHARVTVELPVLVDRGIRGDVGTLTMRIEKTGDPGLRPYAPRMFTTHLDPAVVDSASVAWGSAPERLRGGCVSWAIAHDGMPFDRVEGRSLGAAFGVGLEELARLSMRRPRIRKLDRRAAVSAQLDHAGRLGPVSALDTKLREAHDDGLRVVLPEANRSDVAALADAGRAVPPQIDFAHDLAEALRHMRTHLNRRVVVSVVVVVLAIVGSLLTWAIAANRTREAEQHATRAALLEKVGELRRIASGNQGGSARDQRIQTLVLLAAHDLALEAGDTKLAADMLKEPTTIEPGRKATLPLDIGPVWSIERAGPVVVVGSVSGHIAVINPETFDILATHVEPPGAETLNQPVVTAAAGPANIPVVATALGTSQRTGYELVVFAYPPTAASSKPEQLDVIGRTKTTEKITAMAYRPTGEALLTAGASGLTIWDVSTGQPSDPRSCTLTSGSYSQILTDTPDGRPLLVRPDGQVDRLDSGWEASMTGPCQVTSVQPSVLGTVSSARTHSDGTLQVATVVGDSIVVRVNTEHREIKTSGPIDSVDLASDGKSLLAGNQGAGTLTNIDIQSGKPIATYNGYGELAIHAGQYVLAADTTAHRVDVLVPQTLFFSRGVTIPVGFGGSLQFAVAAGSNAFALTRFNNIDIYALDGKSPTSFIALPDAERIATSGLFGSSFALTDDGRVAAAIVETGGRISSREPRAWIARTGSPLPLPGIRRTPDSRLRNVPIAIEGYDHGFVVTYLLGDIVRFDPARGTWHTTVIQHGSRTTAVWGPMLDGHTLSYLHFGARNDGRWNQEVRSISIDTGKSIDTWHLGPLHLALGPPDGNSELGYAIGVEHGHGAVITTGGEIHELLPGGQLGRSLALTDLGIVLSLARLPDHSVVVAGRNGLELVDLESFTRAPEHNAFGPLEGVAVTPNRRFLVGDSILDAVVSIVPLQSPDQVASICAPLDKDITRAEWSTYVGKVAKFRPLCGRSTNQANLVYHAARELVEASAPFGLRTPSTEELTELAPACSRSDKTSGERSTSAGKVGNVSWAGDSAGLTNNAIGVVCVNGKPRWVVPSEIDSDGDGSLDRTTALRFIGGRGPKGQALVVVARSVVDKKGARTTIDLLTAAGVGVTGIRQDLVLPSTIDGTFRVNFAVGSVLVRATFAPMRDSASWRMVRVVPIGLAPAAP